MQEVRGQSEPMKAITLWQPWASLVATGHKRFETRSWGTSYRGPIAIHAGKNPKYLGQVFWHLLGPEWNRKDLPLGCIVATAELEEVARFSRNAIAQCSDKELALGDWRGGRYGWLLTNVVQLPKPIPARGFQGLWNWDG